jgi:hypothetical protein
MPKPVDLKVRTASRRMWLLRSVHKHGECVGNVGNEQTERVCLARLTEGCHKYMYRGRRGY